MIYVPVAEQTGLRPLIGGDEARRLLGALGELAAPVSHARDRRALEQHYQELMRPGTCAALARTLKSLYAKHLDAAHRRLSAPEEQLMRQTELTLCEELALALGRSEADVRAQLRRALGAERTA